MPWLVTLLIDIVVGYAIGYAVNYFFGKKADPRVFSPKFEDNQAQVRSAVESHKIVYGKSLTSGPLTFAATNGPSNQYMHLVVPVAGHEVEAIDTVYFDDISSDGTEYNKIEKWEIIGYAQISGEVWRAFVSIDGINFAGSATQSWNGNHSRINTTLDVMYGIYRSITESTGYASRNYTAHWTRETGYKVTITGKTLGDEITIQDLHFTDSTTLPNTWITFGGNGSPIYGTVDGNSVAYVNDIYVSLVTKANIFDLYKHLGSPDQPADANLVAENVGWTSNHRLRGRAYLYSKLAFYADRWPTGIPNLKAEVRGRKCYDPRSTLTSWTDNAALCIRDYLTAVHGLGATSAEIDDTAIIAAANICDEYVLASSPKAITSSSVANPTVLTATAHKLRSGDEVAIAGHTGSTPSLNGNHTVTVLTANTVSIPVNVTVGGTCGTIQLRQKRYLANGTIALGERPIDVIQKMLTCCDGTLVYSEGKYKLFVGAYTAPVGDLNESHLRDGLRIVAKPPRKQLFNGVRGTILDPNRFWQETDFPVYKNATYATEDGEEIIKDITLPFTTDAFAAQRIAKQILERSRQSIAVVFPAKLNVFKYAVNDVVRLSIAYLGWTNKEFRIQSWSLTDFGVDVLLQEEASASYNWNNGDETIIDPAPNSNLPSVFDVGMPTSVILTEELYQDTNTGGVKSRIKVEWTASSDAGVVGYVVSWDSFSDAEQALSTTSAHSQQINDTEFYIEDIYPGTYFVRIKAVNLLNISSLETDPVKITVYGLTSAPSDITAFSVIKSSGVALAQWAQSPDLDVIVGGRIIIRYASQTTGATWNDGVILDEFNGSSVNGLLPLITGTYLAKALDSSGNYSANAASFVATEGMVTGFTTVATSTQHTTFTGTKTNVAVVSGALQLDGTILVDSMLTNVDTWSTLDELGGAAATGSYAFNTYLDMTTVATRRFEANVTALSFDTGDLIDYLLDNMDDWGSFDGGVIDDCDVTLYAATTDDNPAGTPTWGAWTPFFVSDFTCRAAKFKLDFVSGQTNHNIAVSVLQVDVKVPA